MHREQSVYTEHYVSEFRVLSFCVWQLEASESYICTRKFGQLQLFVNFHRKSITFSTETFVLKLYTRTVPFFFPLQYGVTSFPVFHVPRSTFDRSLLNYNKSENASRSDTTKVHTWHVTSNVFFSIFSYVTFWSVDIELRTMKEAENEGAHTHTLLCARGYQISVFLWNLKSTGDCCTMWTQMKTYRLLTGNWRTVIIFVSFGSSNEEFFITFQSEAPEGNHGGQFKNLMTDILFPSPFFCLVGLHVPIREEWRVIIKSWEIYNRDFKTFKDNRILQR